MSNIKKVTESFSVSGQVLPKDLANIAESGFKTIVANRPDGESPDQPKFIEIEQAAQDLGLNAIYIPVTIGQPIEGAVQEFNKVLAEMPSPVLAYCRSGGRSMTLWTQATQS